jgi:hypothetical protein
VPSFTIDGNPGAIRSRATTTYDKGQVFFDTGEALSAIDTNGWIGRAADHFRDAHKLEPDRWFEAGNGFRTAGTALQTYASAVEQAQKVGEWAQGEYDRGDQVTSSARSSYDADVSDARQKLAAGIYSSLTIEPFNDPGQAIRDNAISEFNAAKATLEEAAQVCAGQVRAGCAAAPEEPHWWESGLKFVGGIFQGAGEAVWDLLTISPFGAVNMIQDSWKLATGDLTPEELAKKYELSLETVGDMWQALQDDPVEFGKNLGKGLLDWDTWADDPARAIGHLVPDAIVAALTAGSGTVATRGVKGGADAMDALADISKMSKLDDLDALTKMDDLDGLTKVDDLTHLDDLDKLDNLDDLAHLDDAGDLASLSDAETNAIRRYTGSMYDEINSHLRGTDPTFPVHTPEELAKVSDEISTGLDKLPAYDGTTYRGTDLPDGILDKIEPGGSYRDPAFSSTSDSVDVAQDFRSDGNTLFHIDGNSGHDIQDISIFDKTEAEVLFDKNHEFQVVDKVWNEDGGYWDIYLKD